MKYLYIDTSSKYLYTAIVEENNLIAEVSEEYGQNLSEMALPRIVSMFEKEKLTAKDIDKIIVVDGPGSFTGIRIGLTIAKVYAWSLNIPITTITSLEAMATSSKSEKIHVPLIDARRGFVYAAVYDNEIELLKPQHIPFDKLQLFLKDIKDYEYISNDELDMIDKVNNYKPDYLKIIRKYKDKKPINPHLVNPEYLKLTEAEENKR